MPKIPTIASIVANNRPRATLAWTDDLQKHDKGLGKHGRERRHAEWWL